MDKKTRKNTQKKIQAQIVNRDHLAELAKPRRRISLEEEFTLNPAVKKVNSKYKASRRIQSLAKPKHVVQKKTDREPGDDITRSITIVSRSALAYMPTKRIMELAKPK